MAKIQIKSEKITPFGGIFPIMDEFNRVLSGIVPTSRIKTFVFKFVSVAAKWIKAARQNVLNIYTSNQAYAKLDFG